MPRDLVPIKVKIGKKPNGHAEYPQFNLIPNEIRKHKDWSVYVDAHGAGWHYDKCCGHDTDTPESPHGQQFGVLMVPKDFAEDAIARFPEVTKLTEAETEAFYDTHAHAHEPDELVDEKALKPFEMKERMGVTLTNEERQKRNRAMDPDNPEPGIKRNMRKKFRDFKTESGIRIVQ